ncbi:MAG TPA: hypothetical protein VFG00_09140, partial [Acidothermaceae bacterium]|nr:hypothetical protein [Acidothermaceae bacterium]
DTAGFQGIRFIVAVGTITATAVTSVKVQDGAAANLSDAADVAGTGLTITAGGADDNSIWIIDIFRPVKRYCTVNVLRGTANAVIDGAFAELYDGRYYPEAKDATVHGQKVLTSPIDGTP